MSFSYSVSEIEKNIKVLRLSGRLIERNQALQMIEEVEEWTENGSVKVVIDLEKLEYMNSSGLNILITLLTKARKSGGEAIIANESDIIKNLLVITKLNHVFTIAENMENGVEILKNK